MPRPVEKVTMYKTTDGQTYSEELIAQHHQQHLDLVARIRDQIDQFYGEGMSSEAIAEHLAGRKAEMKMAYGF